MTPDLGDVGGTPTVGGVQHVRDHALSGRYAAPPDHTLWAAGRSCAVMRALRAGTSRARSGSAVGPRPRAG